MILLWPNSPNELNVCDIRSCTISLGILHRCHNLYARDMVFRSKEAMGWQEQLGLFLVDLSCYFYLDLFNRFDSCWLGWIKQHGRISSIAS